MKPARSPFPPLQPEMRLRSLLTLGLVMAWLLAMLGRVFYLQVIKADDLRRKALSQMFQTVEIPPERGRIIDASGCILAEDVPAYSLWVAPHETENLRNALESLSDLVAFDSAAFMKRVRDGKRFIPVARKLPLETGDRVKGLRLRGVYLLPDRKRIYPLGAAAAPLLGFVGFEGKGMDGVEAFYQDELAGRPGRLILKRDGRGRIMDIEEDIPPVPGKTLRLTIEAPIQQAAFDALREIQRRYTPKSAVCVAVAPDTGDVLAMASIPSYDPENLKDIKPEALRNRAVTDVFEPGSSFKPFVMAAALELGLVSLDEEWNCHFGTWRIRGRTIHDAHGYGTLDTAGILIKSSNIGMAQVGLRIYDKLGFEGFRQAVAAFGFGSRTGIRLPSESPGLLLPHTRWTYYSVTSIPMGQEIAVSPLQLSIGYAALINGGVLPVPRIVHSWEWRGRVLESIPSRRRGRVISPATSRAIRRILRRVVEEGTGKRARIPGFSVGGKTGTAQKAENGRYVPGKYIAVFSGFAPVERPRINVVVMVDEPKGAHYGGTVAAPAVRRVLQTALPYFGVQPDIPQER